MMKKYKLIILNTFILLLLILCFSISNGKNLTTLLFYNFYSSGNVGTGGQNTIYNLSNPDDICQEIMNNNKLKVGIYNYYDQESYYVESPSESCNNTSYYDNNLSNITKDDNYDSWTYFARTGFNNTVYIDDIKVKSKGEDNIYSYFYISNKAATYEPQNSGGDEYLIKNSTLKPGEKIFLDLNLSDIDMDLDNKELRVSINYGHGSSDLRVDEKKSIAYYLYSKNNKIYGPFKLEFSSVERMYYIKSSSGKTLADTVIEYNLVSENLLKDVPSNVEIEKIRIVPYEFLASQSGVFRIYNLAVSLYDKYKDPKEYINVNNAEDITRHNIVNNMMNEATIKWAFDNSNIKMKVYYPDGRGPIDGTKNEVYYGLPYVSSSMGKGTINSFIGQTIKDNSNDAYYSYNIADKYLKNINSSTGIAHQKGDSINSNNGIMYIINSDSPVWSSSDGTYTSIINKTINNHSDLQAMQNNLPEFINNEGRYLYGVSCSTSAGAAFGPEVPYKGYIPSDYFLISNQVEPIGGLYFTKSEIVEVLREKNIVTQNANMTSTQYKRYYSSFIQSKFGTERVYDSYGLSLPGDFIAHPGHVELITGMPYVECNDGTSTRNYISDFCLNHGGINPENSYLVTTTVGGSSYNFKGDINSNDGLSSIEEGDSNDNTDEEELPDEINNIIHSSTRDYLLSSETGWSYTLNSKYTDLESIDDIYTNPNVLAGNKPNKKRSFLYLYARLEDLDELNDKGLRKYRTIENNEIPRENNEVIEDVSRYNIYVRTKSSFLPFRLKSMDKLRNNLVEKPVVKYVLDKDYSDKERNDLLFNYIKNNKSLKGTIFTNYMINGIRIEIDNEKYYLYPEQINNYSFYSDFSDERIRNALQNIDYGNNVEITVSINMGPNINEVKQILATDEEGYFEVLKVKNPRIETTLLEVLTNNKYVVNNNYVTGFKLGDTIASLKSLINDNEVTFITNNEIISTGTIIKKGNEEYNVVIKGDLTGDGKINSGDLLNMRKYLLEEISLSGPNKSAGIIESINEIKSLDLLRLRQYLLGEYAM